MKKTEPGSDPHILLVNPWIHDFAAYDVWAKPLGLLQLAAILRLHGFRVSYVDCLDRFHPKGGHPPFPRARQGRGPYLKTPVPNPPGLEDIPRTFSRYGIAPQWLSEDLAALSPPDLVLVTSLMTYWYPGVAETIAVIRRAFPRAPILLGGIYATLCPDHAAACCGADRVVTGMAESAILSLAAEYTGRNPSLRFDPQNMDTWPYPALDLERQIPHVPLLTSRGCPFSCDYCASGYINPVRMRRSPASVVEEIRYWHEAFGVIDFAFYDDALLIDADRHVVPMLEQIVAAGLPVRFHTPNALHIRRITAEVARLMFAAGFATLRLGLETTAADRRRQMDGKVEQAEFVEAVAHLKRAGFTGDRIGAYLLAGLPGQPLAEVEASIRLVRDCGITPIPAYYTPIPHTAMWEKAKAASRYDLEKDPVFTNNAVCPCSKDPFSWAPLTRLKQLVRGDMP
ncbi:MAG: B12-binding domain-containing radical SAM protein [Desulfobacterales bacterium]|nr:B12-binding domain-containing radical SAM protein [Desulfobacterales bacterium]